METFVPPQSSPPQSSIAIRIAGPPMQFALPPGSIAPWADSKLAPSNGDHISNCLPCRRRGEPNRQPPSQISFAWAHEQITQLIRTRRRYLWGKSVHDHCGTTSPFLLPGGRVRIGFLAARRLCGAQLAHPEIQLRFLRPLGYGLPCNALKQSMLGHAGFFTALPIARVQRNEAQGVLVLMEAPCAS
jgi:hypothetical protein